MTFASCRARLAVVAALLAAGGSGATSAETYRLDPVHTRVVFVVDHAGLSRAIGAFSGVQGRLEFDPDALADANVALVVPLATLELGDDDWRDAVLDGTFLDAGDFPQAHFESTAVAPDGDGSARITGMLTLRGVTREVVLDARLNAVKRHPVTRRRSAGFSATATLSRRDFGIDAWPNVVGDEIALMIEAEAILDADAVAPPRPPGAAPVPTPPPAAADVPAGDATTSASPPSRDADDAADP